MSYLTEPAPYCIRCSGRVIGRIEADLEGFARDLRELLVHPAAAVATV